jgi:energy-converting hydrogenase Eha subunit B
MHKLILTDGNRYLGNIGDADVKVLIAELEEEDMADQDYFIDGATVSILEAGGASKELVAMLLAAIGDSDGVDVRWE